MTKLGLFCDRLIEAGWLVAVATVPLYFDIYSSRVFEPDKISVLRGLVLVMALAQVVKWLENFSTRRKDQSLEAGNGVEELGQAPSKRWWPWWRENPLAFPTLLMAGTYVLGTIFSVGINVSILGSYQRLQGTYSLFSYILLFFLMAANLRQRVQLDRLFNVILLISLPISLYGIVQHFHRDPLPWGGDVTMRVTSTLGNAIFLPAYLIMVMPIALYRLIVSAKRVRGTWPKKSAEVFNGWEHVAIVVGIIVVAHLILAWFADSGAKSGSLWWGMLPLVGAFTAMVLFFTVRRPTFFTALAEGLGCLILLGLQLVATYLSQSRGPELGLLAGLGCFALLFAIVSRSKLMIWSFSGLGAVLLAVLIVFNLPNGPLERFQEIPYVGRLGQLTETEGGTGKVRVLIWQGTKDLLTKRPPIGLSDSDPLGPARLLVGYGPESMYVVYNKVYPADLAHYEARNASPDRNHDDILDYLVNVGILGLAAYLFLLGAAVYVIWRHLRRAPTVAAQLPLIAILSALVAHFVESLVGIVIAATWTYFWAYLAVIVAAELFYSRREEHQQAVVAAAVVPAMAVPVGAASRVSFGGARRRRGGRGDSVIVQRATEQRGQASRKASGRSLAIPYPVLVLIGLVLLLLLTLSRTIPINGVETPLRLSFLGLVLGAVAIALSLGPWSSARSWHPENSWLYVVGLAVVAFLVIVNLNGIAADIFYKRGFGADSQRNFPASIAQYNEAIRLAPDQDYYYLFLGRAYLELSKGAKNPNVTPAFQPTLASLITLQPAEISQLGRDDLLRASQVALEQARVLNPLNTDHYANLGRLYRTWGEFGDRSKYDLADNFYRQATTLSPHNAQLFVEWAQVDLDKGALDDALAKTQQAALIDDKFVVTFVQLGDIFQAKGQLDPAIDSHGKALRLDPAALSDARFEKRFDVYDKAGMLPRLEVLYAAATQKSPDSAPAHAAYGFILSRENKIREALPEFQANVRLVPTDWIAHRNLVYVYQNLGMIDQAIRSAQDSLRYAPQDQQAGLQNIIGELQKRK